MRTIETWAGPGNEDNTMTQCLLFNEMCVQYCKLIGQVTCKERMVSKYVRSFTRIHMLYSWLFHFVVEVKKEALSSCIL